MIKAYKRHPALAKTPIGETNDYKNVLQARAPEAAKPTLK